MKESLRKKIDNLVTYDLSTCMTTVQSAKRRVARKYRIPARQAAKVVKDLDRLASWWNPTLDI